MIDAHSCASISPTNDAFVSLNLPAFPYYGGKQKTPIPHTFLYKCSFICLFLVAEVNQFYDD